MAVTLSRPPSYHGQYPDYRPSSSSTNIPAASILSPSSDSYNSATTLPSISIFNFSDLRDRMTAFSTKFDAFLDRSRRQVLSERNEYRGRLSELREDQSSTLKALSALQSTHKAHAQATQQQSAELRDLHSTIATITARRDAVAAGKERLQLRIEEAKRRIDVRREAQREFAERFERQKGRDGPEVGFWEGILGMRLESAANDNGNKEGWVRVVFWELPTNTTSSTSTSTASSTGMQKNANANCSTGTGEAWFELDCSSDEYRLGRCVPSLKSERSEDVLERLNGEGDIGAFLKRMRGLIVEVLTGGDREK